MFLSNSGAGFGDSKSQAGEKDQMTLQDLKEKAMGERNDITLDFEQFMRIYSFQKSKSSKAKSIIIQSP